MPIGSGINHIATMTSDMGRTVGFYEQVFDAVVTYEVPKDDDRPWMKVVDLAAARRSTCSRCPRTSIIGERRRIGGRGAIDHFGIAVDSLATLERVKQRLAEAGAQEVGEIQPLGDELSLFFRDPDGMELEVCCSRPA